MKQKIMNDDKFREQLRKGDIETLEERVVRRNELGAMRYRVSLPQTMFDYIACATDMYISGHFIGAILMSATIVELALANTLVEAGKATHQVVECLTLAEKTNLCYQFRMIDRNDKKRIDCLRNIRNALAHANVGKLTKEARHHYSTADEAILQVLSSLYLSDFGAALKSDALECLEFARNLTQRWYGG